MDRGLGKDAAAPLVSAIEEYSQSDRLGFHVPGHNQGKGLPTAYKQVLDRLGALFDFTELPGLDNLAAPADSIRCSQKKMARQSGTKAVYYLVNGSTAGLEAAMLAMSSPDVPVILPAHCHMAIHQGLILTGSMPLILPCSVDVQWGLPLGVDKQAVKDWVEGEPAIITDGRGMASEALWISVNPTYHGIMADLAWEQSLLSGRSGWAWLVDEAHGAHLPFVRPTIADAQSYSALSFPADVVVQSAHKMGIALTQAGLLHCNRPELAGRLKQSLSIMQSSSPSYLLLASLDVWQAYLQEEGTASLRYSNDLALELSNRIRALGGYRLWRDELPPGYFMDPRKITLSAGEFGIDGYRLAELLRRNYHIDVELASQEYVLLVAGLGLDEAGVSRMEAALKKIKDLESPMKGHDGTLRRNGSVSYRRDEGVRRRNRDAMAAIYKPGQKPWKPTISPREAFLARHEKVALTEAEGRLAAVSVSPYPPGIPVIYPGMKIQKEIIEAIKTFAETESHCAGLERKGSKLYIEVVAEGASVAQTRFRQIRLNEENDS